MDERDGIIWGGFCGVAVIAPQVHALAQEGDEVFLISLRGGSVKGDIMKTPEIGQVRKGGEAGGEVCRYRRCGGGSWRYR